MPPSRTYIQASDETHLCFYSLRRKEREMSSDIFIIPLRRRASDSVPQDRQGITDGEERRNQEKRGGKRKLNKRRPSKKEKERKQERRGEVGMKQVEDKERRGGEETREERKGNSRDRRG